MSPNRVEVKDALGNTWGQCRLQHMTYEPAGIQAASSEKCDDENREDARIRSTSNAWDGECAGLP